MSIFAQVCSKTPDLARRLTAPFPIGTLADSAGPARSNPAARITASSPLLDAQIGVQAMPVLACWCSTAS
jgi:hypothetical protein